MIRAFWLLAHPSPPDGDERVYMRLAENLAHHSRFGLEPSGPLEGHFGPLYPALQALAVGSGLSSLHAGWLVSILAGAASVALVYLLGLRVWTRPLAAAVAAAAAIFHPPMISASRHVYPEALSSVFLLLAILSLFARSHVGAMCGASLGGAALTRREAVLLVPVIVVWLLSTTLRRRPTERRALLQAAWLVLAFVLVFGPYLIYVRNITGRWALSSKTNYAWIVGRLMEERPGEGLLPEDVRRLEETYPTPIDWIRARPGPALAGVARSAGTHLWLSFTGTHSWPIGILAIVGFAVALRAGRLRAWPPSAVLLPFALVLAWAVAGPFVRYSKALGPFVCLLLGGLLLNAGEED